MSILTHPNSYRVPEEAALYTNWMMPPGEQNIVGPAMAIARSTVGYYTNSSGVLTQVAANVPRDDDYAYENGLWVKKGLLVEEARTNLTTWSQEFGNAAWTKNGVAVTSNAALAPDGTITADAIEQTAEGGYIRQIEGIGALAVGTYICSVYAKAKSTNYIVLHIRRENADSSNIGFNLLTGEKTANDASALNDWDAEDVGGGWFRVWVVFSITTSGGATQWIRFHPSNNTTSFGNGTGSVYLWQADLVAGNGIYPTTPIPTTTVAVTRAADMPTFDMTSLSRAAGTYVLDAEGDMPGHSNTNWLAGDGSGVKRLMYNHLNSATLRGFNGVEIPQFNCDNMNARFRAALAYDSSSMVGASNGVLGVATANSNDNFALVGTLNIGSTIGTIYAGRKWYRSLRFYPFKMSDAELKRRTAI